MAPENAVAAPAARAYRVAVSTDALIVAAGRGLRAGGGLPKQYRPIAGQPLLRWTAQALLRHAGLRRVHVVIASGDEAECAAALHGLALPPPIVGGASRQDSVRLGLEAMAGDPPGRVLIHDGARPFLPPAVIDRVCAALDKAAAAIAALPVADTLKCDAAGKAVAGPDRTGLWRAQTPQGFDYATILAAHRAAHLAGLAATDDAAIAEWHGIPVALVAGAEENFKVTGPEDLARAETHAATRLEVRVGQGFDVHAFAAAEAQRPLMLCGVRIPGSPGLAGHSDADVALHALCDAIYGALAEEDIGAHFPPGGDRFRDAGSAMFVEHACARIAARGGLLRHVDLTLVCEAPRIGPHRLAMRQSLAGMLQLPLERVSVKATTTERLGFLGRGEGIAALALAGVALPREAG